MHFAIKARAIPNTAAKPPFLAINRSYLYNFLAFNYSATLNYLNKVKKQLAKG
ncbi:MAG: hypothetical protein RMY62_021920 [Nostoc sp. ZfuVER08]|nr:hypothetical protein [Nostoc sp. ZfuVER08]